MYLDLVLMYDSESCENWADAMYPDPPISSQIPQKSIVLLD